MTDTEILNALHEQIERLPLRTVPMTYAETTLANAILVLLNVLMEERRQRG